MKNIFILLLLLVGILCEATVSAQQFVHNITADSIVTPPKGALLPRNNCPVEIKFTNNGLENEDSVRVIMVFKGRFSVSTDTVIIPTLYSGQSETVRFDPIKQTDPAFDTIYGIVSFQNDENRKDDTISQSYRSSCPSNIQTSLVTSPPLDSIIYPNSQTALSAVFKWWGEFTTSKLNVKVRVQIRNWPENFLQVQIDTVIPEISFYKNNINVVFPSKQGIYKVSNLQKGTYKVSATSLLADDCDRTNDTAFSYFTITDKIAESDILIDSLLSPRSNKHYDTNVVPIRIKLRNDGTSKGLNKTFIAKVSVGADSVMYRDTILIPVLGKRSILDTQFTNLVISRKGPYYPEYKLEIAATPPNEDQVWRDTVRSVFTIGEPSKVKLLAITYPAHGDTIDAGTAIRPKLLLKALWGADFSKFKVRVEVQSLRCELKYTSEAILPSALDVNKDPIEYELPVPSCDQFGIDSISKIFQADYRLTCYIISDNNKSDSLSLIFTVRGNTLHYYLQIDSILFNEKGSILRWYHPYYPQILLRNIGPVEVFDIKVIVNINDAHGDQYYNFEKDVVSLASGDSILVNFSPFSPTEIGWHNMDVAVYDDYLLYCFNGTHKHESFKVAENTSAPNVTNPKPGGIDLLEAHPNPFSATTTLSYEVRSAGYVTIHILDVAGVTMKTVMSDEFASEGKHQITLDGSDLPSGTYFVEVLFKNSDGRSVREIQPVTLKR